MTEKVEKKGFATLDVFIVIGAILLVLGMIGQNLAVYYLNRRDSAEDFEISFVVRSIEKEEAQRILSSQEQSEQGLSCTVGESVVGRFGTLHRADIPALDQEQGVHPHLCDLTGILVSKGRSTMEQTLLFGYGAVAVGDVLMVDTEQGALALEITGVNVKKNEKST